MASVSEPGMRVEGCEAYPAKWRQYRLRRNVAYLFVVGWVPFCAGLFWLSRYRVHMPFLSIGAMVVWVLCAIAAVYWAGEFRCPRCRRRYGSLGNKKTSNVMRGLFDAACTNCYLRKFEL